MFLWAVWHLLCFLLQENVKTAYVSAENSDTAKRKVSKKSNNENNAMSGLMNEVKQSGKSDLLTREQ